MKRGAAVNAFNLLESERHTELDVGSRVCVVGELLVVVESVVLCTESECLMPLHTCFLPLREPLQLCAGSFKELHLHLLELAHTEYELTRNDFVTECLTNLCDTKRNLHAAGLLHVQVVNENTLSGLRTQIYLHCAVCRRAHLGREHEVELAYVGPVACSADRANYLLVEDYLLQGFQIRALHGLGIACMKCVALSLCLGNTRRSLQILSLIEAVAETLARLLHLFLNLDRKSVV